VKIIILIRSEIKRAIQRCKNLEKQLISEKDNTKVEGLTIETYQNVKGLISKHYTEGMLHIEGMHYTEGMHYVEEMHYTEGMHYVEGMHYTEGMRRISGCIRFRSDIQTLFTVRFLTVKKVNNETA